MKKTRPRILPILCLIGTFSQANELHRQSGDRDVRILTVDGIHRQTGDVVPAGKLFTILFTSAPCALNIAGRERMFRAWQIQGQYQLGCWYPTVTDGYVVIDGEGDMTPQSIYWESLPRALLHSDGTATITEPNYDSTSFLQQIWWKKYRERAAHMNEKP